MSDFVERNVIVSKVFHDGTSMHVLNAGTVGRVPRSHLAELEDEGVVEKAAAKVSKAADGGEPKPRAKPAAKRGRAKAKVTKPAPVAKPEPAPVKADGGEPIIPASDTAPTE